MTTGPGPPASGDPLLALLSALEPTLDQETLTGAIGRAAARPDGRRRLARTVVDRPELLTGQGAHADSPAVLRLIAALAEAGASAVVMPSCPRCGRQKQLGPPVEGIRLCHGCRPKARALPYGRCGKVRPTARRNDHGQSICQNCRHQDPRSWKPCTKCGNNRRVAAITETGPVCQTCRPGHDLPCTFCGSTDSRIGISRALGKPVCERCRQRWIVCSACGNGAVLKGGTLEKPLCARCLDPDPTLWKRCATCQTTWQLSAAQCARCSLDRKLKDLFNSPGGTTAPELDRLREALVQSDRPDSVDTWLTRPGVRTTLHEVASGHRRLSRELIDAMPRLTLTHLRSMLVTSGALPSRDERLIALETWIDQTIAARAVPEHQRVLRGYAVWHHLRRLHGRLHGRPVSHLQANNVRQHVTAAATFLEWLEARELTLQTCHQADLDLWLADHPGHRTRTANFARWAVTHRHAFHLTAPSTRRQGPSGPLDQDRRWTDARRLLHDDSCPVADRAAGLLVLLHAQKLSDITALTTEHVGHQDGRTLLHLGSRPITLSSPLDALIDELVLTRKTPGSTVLTEESAWLFPGRWHGRPLTEGALSRRLHALGLDPRQSRNTALFALAAELPAAILAKTLGIHIKGAIHWQKIAAGDWAAYAADVNHRLSPQG
ncbi:site-specific integrase [Streptomyces sp. NPDC059479]|uniref:site-specific integrase n=1 Tax=Streptomyces sp. NPDC059479 TaxID=3346848 RepID=UPI0036A7352A